MFNIVTGKLGNGKSLYAIAHAWDYFIKGRRVVSNFPIDFSSRPHLKNIKNYTEVIPDLPTPDDLLVLGRGGKSEREAGLIIIDEAARWLNSRDWGDKNRKGIIDFLLHTRKLGWDVVLIVQSHDMLDKQVRTALMEHHTICRRMDRLKIMGISLPHLHLASTYYGTKYEGSSAPKVASKWYRPAEWGAYYETNAIFQESTASYCMLSRWHQVTRYKGKPMQLKDYALLPLKIVYYIIIKTMVKENAQNHYLYHRNNTRTLVTTGTNK